MTEVPFKPNKITVAIDRTEELKAKDNEIARLNQELGEERERLKAIRVNDPAPAPKGGETAILQEESDGHTLRNFDYEHSEILDMLKFSSIAEAIQTTEYLSRKGSPDAQRAIQQLTRKMLKSKPISLEFQGSVKDLATKREKLIPEFCDDTTRKQIEAWNSRVRANRLNWKETN
jgi:hypothetical protein